MWCSQHKLEKTHDTDAYCIAAGTMQTVNPNIRTDVYEIKQFRRHNRANIHHQTERTYKLNGQTVARNRRKRTDQKTDSLAEWFENTVKQYGQQKAEHLRAGLKVRKSTRYYNSKDRVMPGAVFQYEGNRYVVTGQLSGGQYYRAYGKGNQNFPVKKIRIISLNRGLVYVA